MKNKKEEFTFNKGIDNLKVIRKKKGVVTSEFSALQNSFG